MAEIFKDTVQEAVWEVMQEINRAWVHGRPEEMELHLHPDMVIVTSDVEYRADGRQACIASYKDFCDRATIQDYKEDKPNVDVFGDQAVVIYQFDISYELEGAAHRDKGADIFVFKREQDQWRAIWRTLVAFGEEEGGD
jgi:ketosteroid isomerase-like protein